MRCWRVFRLSTASTWPSSNAYSTSFSAHLDTSLLVSEATYGYKSPWNGSFLTMQRVPPLKFPCKAACTTSSFQAQVVRDIPQIVFVERYGKSVISPSTIILETSLHYKNSSPKPQNKTNFSGKLSRVGGWQADGCAAGGVGGGSAADGDDAAVAAVTPPSRRPPDGYATAHRQAGAALACFTSRPKVLFSNCAQREMLAPDSVQ